MAYFKDADHLYRVIATTITTAAENEPAMKTRLAGSGMIFRFTYHDPEGIITVNPSEEIPEEEWIVVDEERLGAKVTFGEET